MTSFSARSKSYLPPSGLARSEVKEEEEGQGVGEITIMDELNGKEKKGKG